MAEYLRLGDLITIQRGKTYKSGLIGRPGPTLLGLGTIHRHGGFKGDDLRTYGGESPEELLVHPGQVYASLKDVTQTADLLGAVAKLPNDGPIGRLTQDTVRIDIVNNNQVPIEYLYWIMRTPEYRSYCRSHATGTTTMGLPREDFFAFQIPKPTIHRVALTELLGALDDKIAANDRITEAVKALLSAKFARLQVDVDANGADMIPLTELIELNPRLDTPRADKPVYLEMKNLPGHAMTASSWSCREARGGSRFQNGDTLLARITPCLENGKTGFVDFLPPKEVGIGSTEYIVLRPREGVPTTLPYFVATSRRFRAFAIRHMVGTSGRQRLAAADLSDFLVRRPDRHELTDFAHASQSLMARVKAAVDESRALQTTRDELLPLLMSGKVRVRDAEKVVEEVV